MTLNLEGVLLLDAIARAGSFAQAARDLGKVPSALTYSVRQLEEDLDVLLFDRRGRRATLTPAGRTLLADGRRLLGDADALVKRVQQIGSGWETDLRIGVDALISFEAVAPLLADFDRLGAPTRLRLTYEVFNGTWHALCEDRVDLALGASGAQPPPLASPVPTGGSAYSAPLGSVAFVFCVAANHPLAATDPDQALSVAQLRAHRAVVLADSSGPLAGTATGLSVGIVPGQSCITVATMEQKIRAQLAGLGVGYLPEPFARPWLRNGQLVARQTEVVRESASLFYGWRQPLPGKALSWWLGKLSVARVRERLLGGPEPLPFAPPAP